MSEHQFKLYSSTFDKLLSNQISKHLHYLDQYYESIYNPNDANKNNIDQYLIKTLNYRTDLLETETLLSLANICIKKKLEGQSFNDSQLFFQFIHTNQIKINDEQAFIRIVDNSESIYDCYSPFRKQLDKENVIEFMLQTNEQNNRLKEIVSDKIQSVDNHYFEFKELVDNYLIQNDIPIYASKIILSTHEKESLIEHVMSVVTEPNSRLSETLTMSNHLKLIELLNNSGDKITVTELRHNYVSQATFDKPTILNKKYISDKDELTTHLEHDYIDFNLNKIRIDNIIYYEFENKNTVELKQQYQKMKM